MFQRTTNSIRQTITVYFLCILLTILLVNNNPRLCYSLYSSKFIAAMFFVARKHMAAAAFLCMQHNGRYLVVFSLPLWSSSSRQPVFRTDASTDSPVAASRLVLPSSAFGRMVAGRYTLHYITYSKHSNTAATLTVAVCSISKMAE